MLVRAEVLDPTDLVTELSATPLPEDLEIELVDGVVRFQAEQLSSLGWVAEPLVAWWRRQGTDATLRLVAAGSDAQLSHLAGESAIEIVRYFIENEAGAVRVDEGGAGEHREPRRSRRRHGDFTAGVVGVSEDAGILSVGVAQHHDGSGRSLILQGVDPASRNSELLEPDESYCLTTETAATIYGGVRAIALRDRMLRIRLTRAAAKTLRLRAELTITLNVDNEAVAKLRSGIRQVMAYGAGSQSPPLLELE